VEYQGKILIEFRVEMLGIRHHLEGLIPILVAVATRAAWVLEAPHPPIPARIKAAAATANNPVLPI
jgi:hypothetical protein